jgi:hypothetical protein
MAIAVSTSCVRAGVSAARGEPLVAAGDYLVRAPE